MPDFEVFDKRSIPIGKQPMATIQKAGPISLNRAAYHALGEPEAVELLFDTSERIIGLRAVDPLSAPHAYPIRTQGKGNTFLVAGTAFFRFYGVDTSVSRRYFVQMFDDVLGIDLKQNGVEVTSNRDRRKRQEGPQDPQKSAGPRPVEAEAGANG